MTNSKHKTGSLGKALSNTPSQERILKKRGYVLGNCIGEGSYAKVYKAEYVDPVGSKSKPIKLACKVVDGTTASKEFLKKFFPREIEIMSKVNHTNLIRVHSILERKPKYYIFMQYAENGDLLDFLKENGALNEFQAREWFSQLLNALQYLHNKDIAHRDLKCENILITSTFNIKLSDFGFARFATDNSGRPVLSNTFCGSISYAPPEIIRGTRYNCKLADLWSIGVILYVMLNKSLPFDDSSLKRLYEAQTHRIWAFRSKYVNTLSKSVKDFVAKLLEPVPASRLSIAEMQDDVWITELADAKPAFGTQTSNDMAKNNNGIEDSHAAVAKIRRSKSNVHILGRGEYDEFYANERSPSRLQVIKKPGSQWTSDGGTPPKINSGKSKK